MAQLVVQVDGRAIVVEGRAAEMIGYLAENASRVNVAQKGDVTFHFGEAQITPTITAIDAPLAVGGREGG